MHIQENNFFLLFANCIPVKGAKKCIVCDLQKETFVEISYNFYKKILQENKVKTYFELIHKLPNHEQNLLRKETENLIKMGLGFFCEKELISSFENLNIDFSYPATISNAIIDIENNFAHLPTNLFDEFAKLGCVNFQIRCFEAISHTMFTTFFKTYLNQPLVSIDLYAAYSPQMGDSDWIALLSTFPCIQRLYVHSAKADKRVAYSADGKRAIFYLSQEITSSAHCGIVHKDYFISNMSHFTESQSFNSCLNRKVGIDIHGNIKNCPSMPQNFGNIKNESIITIVNTEVFKAFWTLSKNKISVCQDCEFRHICTDCRAYITDNDNILSKPAKCTYNPYIGKWG